MTPVLGDGSAAVRLRPTVMEAGPMILKCDFEELAALTASAGRLLEEHAHAEGGRVCAPPRVIETLEALLPELQGDLSITTLAEQQRLEEALELVLEDARQRMDRCILEQHPAAEDAINAYFEYAHILAVLDRLRRMGAEMRAIIELTTGRPADEETARTVTFPD
ncbi:MAG: hypothetical protein DIU52_006620 [bacterium]